MKNKVMLLIIVLIGFIGFRINVNAEFGSGDKYKTYFEKGKQPKSGTDG